MMLMDVMIQAVGSTWVSCSQEAPQSHVMQQILSKTFMGGGRSGAASEQGWREKGVGRGRHLFFITGR